MGKHSKPGCGYGLALRLLRVMAGAVLTLAACNGGGGTGDRTPGIHEGDGCQHLGQERLDAYGHTVVCYRGYGEASAKWVRK